MQMKRASAGVNENESKHTMERWEITYELVDKANHATLAGLNRTWVLNVCQRVPTRRKTNIVLDIADWYLDLLRELPANARGRHDS